VPDGEGEVGKWGVEVPALVAGGAGEELAAPVMQTRLPPASWQDKTSINEREIIMMDAASPLPGGRASS
jgi:hypothetical protein